MILFKWEQMNRLLDLTSLCELKKKMCKRAARLDKSRSAITAYALSTVLDLAKTQRLASLAARRPPLKSLGEVGTVQTVRDVTRQKIKGCETF